MLTASISCTDPQCISGRGGKALTSQKFSTYKELAFGIQALLVGCHAVVPHCNHQLDLRITGEPESERHELVIACEATACRLKKIKATHHVPIELVGAMVLIFHTGHEGHPLRVWYAGEEWATQPVP